MASNLEDLLRRLRDGTAGPGDAQRARAMVQDDARLPDEIRDVALASDEELAEDAAGLLSVLGVDDLGALLAEAVRAEAEDAPVPQVHDGWELIAEVLREGLRAEAGQVDVADGVLRRLAVVGFAWGPVIAAAVRAEAGVADVSAGVVAALELSALPPVAEAVRAEAGDVDVTGAVFAELGIAAAVPLAEAVRAEAGSIDLADAVLAELSLQRAGAPPVVVQPAASAPRAANDNHRFRWSTVALAAAAVFSVVVGAVSLSGRDAPPEPMLFAHAGEVVVEDLSYGNDVQVFQTEGDHGAVILWVDEEA